MRKLDSILKEMVEKKASDVILKVGSPEKKELVLSFGVKGLGRFRATLFQQRGTLVIVQTFDQALLGLYKEGKITKETTVAYAERKNEVLMSIKELN